MDVNQKIAHCWEVTLKTGEIIELARQVFCKPISEEEAVKIASEHGEVIKAEPIAYNKSLFWK